MPEQRVVIFDLDNTLVLNKPAAKAAYEAAIQFLSNETKLEYRKLFNHWKKLVQQLKSQAEPEKREFEYSLAMLADAHNVRDTLIPPTVKVYEKKLLEELQLVPGAKELVSWLKEQGATVTVAAGTDRAMAKKKLKASNLHPFIDLVVSASDVGSMKPSPTYYQVIMKKFEATPVQTMVVSDSKQEDLEPAKRLGCHILEVPVNNTHLSSLKEPLAEFLSYAK